jgi:hypothetical protein
MSRRTANPLVIETACQREIGRWHVASGLRGKMSSSDGYESLK